MLHVYHTAGGKPATTHSREKLGTFSEPVSACPRGSTRLLSSSVPSSSCGQNDTKGSGLHVRLTGALAVGHEARDHQRPPYGVWTSPCGRMAMHEEDVSVCSRVS